MTEDTDAIDTPAATAPADRAAPSEDPLQGELAAATIVAADAVDKLSALAAISAAVGAPVEGAGTREPRIPLAPGVWARIEIPKFGEPPPLAIDVLAADEHTARREALALLDLLTERTHWSIIPAF